MVYTRIGSKRYNGSVLKYGRKSYAGKSSLAASIAMRALSIAKKNARQMNVEYKRIDVALSANIGSISVPNVIFLTSIGEGVENNERTGRSARLISSYINARLTLTSATNAGSALTVRILVIRDKASNGVAPTAGTIFQSTTSALSPLNSDYFGNRFQLVTSMKLDMYFGAKQGIWLDEFRNLKGETHATWSGTTNGQADAATGHLYFVACADAHFKSGTPNVSMDGIHRTVYIDN